MGARKRQEGGQTIVEFALVLVTVMMFILGIVDLSRAVYARNMVGSAAREGARYAITHPIETEADRAKVAEQALALVVGLERDLVEVTVSEHASGKHVQVDVTYRFHPIAMLIGQYVDGGSGSGLLLHGRSIMRREG